MWVPPDLRAVVATPSGYATDPGCLAYSPPSSPGAALSPARGAHSARSADSLGPSATSPVERPRVGGRSSHAVAQAVVAAAALTALVEPPSSEISST